MLVSRYLHDSLDMLGIGACEYNAEHRAVSWNQTFLRFFPEDDGLIHCGESYADNLRRFYLLRLTASELPDLERYIAEGVARHHNQTQPFEFFHNGRHLRASSLRAPDGSRLRLWQPLDRPVGSKVIADGGPPVFDALRFIPDGATILDAGGSILVANDAFRQLYEIPDERPIVGLQLVDLIARCWEPGASPPELRASIRNGLLYDGAPFEIELPGQRWRRVIARHSVEGIGCFIHADITAAKRQEMALVQAQEALRKANAELVELAQTDSLTGLANRRRFMAELAAEAAKTQSLSLLIIDVDYFKAVNDQFGHVVGDGCLQQVAQLLEAMPMPSSRLIARLGGEEFGVLLPNADLEAAAAIAEATRLILRTAPWHELAPGLQGLTASIGHCHAQCPAYGDALYASADDALYVAKRRGRDRVESAAASSSRSMAG